MISERELEGNPGIHSRPRVGQQGSKLTTLKHLVRVDPTHAELRIVGVQLKLPSQSPHCCADEQRKRNPERLRASASSVEGQKHRADGKRHGERGCLAQGHIELFRRVNPAARRKQDPKPASSSQQQTINKWSSRCSRRTSVWSRSRREFRAAFLAPHGCIFTLPAAIGTLLHPSLSAAQEVIIQICLSSLSGVIPERPQPWMRRFAFIWRPSLLLPRVAVKPHLAGRG